MTEKTEAKKPRKRTKKTEAKEADVKLEEAVQEISEAKAEDDKAETVAADKLDDKAETVSEPDQVKPEAADDASKLPEDLPDVPENERIHRYDIMITSERPGYRPPKAAVYSIVSQLALRGLASPVDEAIAETWTEIYFEPGPTAHEIFLEKGYSDDAPVYHEIIMRFADKMYFCDYSETPQRPLYWSIEIRGARFTTPIGAFKKLFLDALNLRITSAYRDAQPLPPHKIVPEDEKPIEKKKRERGSGIAGTEVEEM